MTTLHLGDQQHRIRRVTVEPETANGVTRVRLLIEANWTEGMSVELPPEQARRLAVELVTWAERVDGLPKPAESLP